jgi:hypothetical protein
MTDRDQVAQANEAAGYECAIIGVREFERREVSGICRRATRHGNGSDAAAHVSSKRASNSSARRAIARRCAIRPPARNANAGTLQHVLR